MKRRVLLVIPSLARGGAERLVVDLANSYCEMVETQVSILSLCKNDSGSFVSDVNSSVGIVELGKPVGFSLRTVFKLIGVLWKLRPDVIHTHLTALEYVLAAKLVLPFLKVVHTVHSSAEFEASAGRRAVRKHFFSLGLAHPVCISRMGAESFRSAYGLNPKVIVNGKAAMSTETVPVTLDTRAGIRKRLGEMIFLTIGRIDRNKNQLEMLKAVMVARRAGRECRLIIAGRVEDEAYFKEISDLASTAPGSFAYLGLVENVSPLLAACDAFCLSSLVEGVPMTILEAMCAGKPIVSTPAGGVPELISDGFNGYLARGYDAAALSEQVIRFCDSGDRHSAMGAAARETFDKYYSIDVCASTYLKVYFESA